MSEKKATSSRRAVSKNFGQDPEEGTVVTAEITPCVL
jgi:hypothetical protein